MATRLKIRCALTAEMKLYFVLYQAEGLHTNTKEPTQYEFQSVAFNLSSTTSPDYL